jgi:exoribonuclease R
MKLKVVISNKNYTEWEYYNADTFEKIMIEENLNPASLKLFSEDVFFYNGKDNNIELIHSVVRSYKNIAGVLLMNRTYGRKNQDKIYYKCIPHDKRLPEFLIPINMKKNNNFDKQNQNKYVTFKYDNWEDKHPYGILCQTIGNTDNLINFFEYQLFSKNLNISITDFSNKTALSIKKNKTKFLIEDIVKKYKNIENRLDTYVISIDPNQCQDYDDAISFKEIDENKYTISIYISNVSIILDYLNLWGSFSERISTIYLPDRKRPMLPTILSDNLCSLKENESRFAIALDLFFDNDNLFDVKYKNVLIKVRNNLTYDGANTNSNEYYNKLFLLTKKIQKKYKYLSEIKDSHDLISFYMLFMNNKVAEFQETFKNGIYRSVKQETEPILPDHLSNDIVSFFKIFHSLSGQYSSYENRSKHMYLHNNKSSYLHITSPIRRLVDLLNLIKFQENLNEINLSSLAEDFYNKWINRLEYINTTMRSIKKVQNNCSLLYMFNTDPNILSKHYEGYLFDKIIRNDGLYQYSVYLHKLNIISKIIINNNYDNYTSKNFELFLFLSENEIKKKIRIKIIE